MHIYQFTALHSLVAIFLLSICPLFPNDMETTAVKSY